MKKSIKKNFIMNIFLTISSILFPLITFPYVSRILLVEGLGKISFASSVMTYFLLFSQLGIPTYGIRVCAKVRDNKDKLSKLVQELMFINTIMTIFVYVVFFILYFNIERIYNEKMLFLVMSTTLLFNMLGMEWLYKSLEEYTYITLRSLIFKVIAVILMFIFVKSEEDYINYAMITVFATSASNIINLIYSKKFLNITKIYKNYNIKLHIKPILIFFGLSTATTIYTNMDNVLLGLFKDANAVGYYNTAIRIKALLLSIVTSLGVVLLPRLSYYIGKGDEKSFLDLIEKSFQFILLISLSISIYFILYAKESVYLIAGQNFQNSIILVKILMPTVIFISFTNLFGIQILVPLGKEKLVLYSVIMGAVANFILNLILIPIYSYVGAAISNLIAEILVLVIQIYFIRDILEKFIRNINFFNVFFAIILASISSYVSKIMGFNDFFTLFSSFNIFYLVYYLVLKLQKNKLLLVIEKQILNKTKRRKYD